MKLKEYAEMGIPLHNLFVVDAHGHLGCGCDFLIPYQNLHMQFEHYRETMRNLSVDYYCVSLLDAILGQIEANKTLLDLMNQDDKLLGWIAYSPYEPQKSLDIIDACLSSNPRCVGIKIHPDWNKCPVNSPRFRPLFEYANAKQTRILSHTWSGSIYDDPSMFVEIAENYKSVKILLGHSGAKEPGISSAIALANKYEQIYLDLTGSFIFSGIFLEDFVARSDNQKLLFSSDTVFNDINWEIGNILYARIPDHIKLGVLGLNAKQFFDLGIA